MTRSAATLSSACASAHDDEVAATGQRQEAFVAAPIGVGEIHRNADAVWSIDGSDGRVYLEENLPESALRKSARGRRTRERPQKGALS